MIEPLAVGVCGLEYPTHYAEWETLTEKHKRLLVIASRDHSKTTFFDKLYPAEKIYCNPGFKILLVSYSDKQVVKLVVGIKELFEQKDLLKPLASKDEENWSQTKLKFKNSAELDSLTFGSAGRGGHYDLILVDDPIKDFAGMNPDDQEQYFLRSLTPMCKPDGQIIVTGNYVYDNDLVERIERNKAYHVGLYPAITNGKALWPEYWSLEKLDERRKEIGEYAFAREYLLQKIDISTQFFKRSMIQYYDPSKVPERMSRVMSLDPAISTNGDDTALIVTGTGEDKKSYLLDYAKLKTDNIQKVVDEVFRLVALYSVPYIQVETIGFQKLLKHWLYEAMREKNLHFGIEEIRTHKKSKEARIMALQPRIEAGSLLFHPKNQEEIIGQLLAFPRGLHDDLIDALSFQVGKWDNPGPIVEKAPVSSWEWWKAQAVPASQGWEASLGL